MKMIFFIESFPVCDPIRSCAPLPVTNLDPSMRNKIACASRWSKMICTNIIKLRATVVTNLYTLDHFLADFPQTCSIMRADEKFLAIIPCMLGLLPEYVIDLP